MKDIKNELYKAYLLIDRKDLLACVSSAYCEDDEKAFKEQYGMSFKEAQKALETLKKVVKSLY